MTNFTKIILFLLFLVQQAHADSLNDIEKRIKAHNEKILPKLKQKEEAVKAMVQKERQNWESKDYNVDGKTYKAAEEHPWIKSGSPRGVNPNSTNDYKADSKNAWDTPGNLTETWSCFQPQLVAYGDCQHKIKSVTWDTADPTLTAACWAHCCTEEFVAYVLWLLLLNPLEHDGILGGGGDYYRNEGRSHDEYYEVVQYWYPENEADINNYGRMRVNPMQLTGEQKSKFLRDTLVQDKINPEKNNPDNITKEIDEGLPTDKYKVKDAADPNWRKDPFKGQYEAREGSADSIDHYVAHVYRTHISSQLGDDKPNTKSGYAREKKSWFDAAEPDTKTKYQLNIWTEYDYFDFLSTVDSGSFSIRGDEKNRSQKFMQGLLQERKNWIKRAGEKNPSYQNKGEVAYRVAKWNQFEPLKNLAKIQDDNNNDLKEVVYFNGLTLYPLSFTYEGNMIPELSLRSISARKAFEISGNEKLSEKFPGKAKSRSNKFTILNSDKSKEVDKVQRVYPLNPDGKTQECYRSQKIPNHLQQTEDTWTEKQFPHDLMGYVKQDFHDSAHIYWNKRLACTCKWDGPSGGFGSQELGWVPDGLGPGRGTGDRIYGKFENVLCTYREGQLPSAWAGEDTKQCDKPGFGQTKIYQGLKDDVSSKSHK